MATAPYLRALALLEQDGGRALPLGGACWGLSLEPRQPLQFRPLP